MVHPTLVAAMAMCIALAAASLVAGDESDSSTRLADSCKKLAAGNPATAPAVGEECKSFTRSPDTCHELAKEPKKPLGDRLATVFAAMTNGSAASSSGERGDVVHAACAMLASGKSLAAACQAARDLLNISFQYAMEHECNELFSALREPPPPPCKDDWVYENFCLERFIKGTSTFSSLPDIISLPDQDCPVLGRPTVKCTVRERPDAVTKDCCNIISHGCRCYMKEKVLASTQSMGVDAPYCFKDLNCQ